MKPEDMTNEELADEVKCVPGAAMYSDDGVCCEASARLRAMSWRTDMGNAQTGERVFVNMKAPWAKAVIARWNTLWDNWIPDGEEMPTPGYDGEIYGIGRDCVDAWMPLTNPHGE